MLHVPIVLVVFLFYMARCCTSLCWRFSGKSDCNDLFFYVYTLLSLLPSFSPVFSFGPFSLLFPSPSSLSLLSFSLLLSSTSVCPTGNGFQALIDQDKFMSETWDHWLVGGDNRGDVMVWKNMVEMRSWVKEEMGDVHLVSGGTHRYNVGSFDNHSTAEWQITRPGLFFFLLASTYYLPFTGIAPKSRTCICSRLYMNLRK